MKVYIIGASGMLGSALFLNFVNNNYFKTKGSLKGKKNEYFKKFNNNIDLNIDVLKFKNLEKKILNFNPDYVVNCVGWIKQKNYKNKNLTYLNSVFPHKLNKFLEKNKVKLIHFSTDCVFDGKKGNYELIDEPNAKDSYGKSKYKGEVISKNCLTIRTSIIGHELNSFRGLLEWFLKKKRYCLGYQKAFFSGLTTYEVYKFLLTLFKSKKRIFGIYHLSSKKISKYLLLNKIKKIYKKKIKIKKDNKIRIDRSLSNNLSIKKLKFNSSNWDKMIKQMKNNKQKINNYLKIIN